MKHPPSALLRRYILDEADADERLLVEQHLGACNRCRTKVAQETRLDEWLVESCPVADQPHGARGAFDKLWAQVDGQAADAAQAEPGDTATRTRADGGSFMAPDTTDASLADGRSHASRGQLTAPLAMRRAAGWLVPAAIAAGIALFLWWRGGEPPHLDSAVDPAQDTPIAAAEPEQAPPVDDLDERFDPTRLQAVRGALGDGLCEADEAHPSDDAAFAAACADVCRPLRAQAWPVPMLLRRIGREGGAAAADAALRLAAVSTDCDATLADAVANASRRDAVMARLVAAPARPAGAAYASSLVAALANVAGAPAPGTSLDRRLEVVGLLARDGQPAARAALVRVLDAALRETASTPDAAQTLTALAAAAPVDLVVDVLLEGGTRSTTRAAAESCFAEVAAGDRAAFGSALNGLLPKLPGAQRQLAARWAASVVLPDALPGLCAALALQPDDEQLAGAIGSFGGEIAARGLTVALLAERGRPAANGLMAEIVSCLIRAPEEGPVAPAIAQVLASSRGDELLRIAQALPETRRGDLLLAGLEALPANSASQFRRESLLTALACEGSARDGTRLMAWIGTRPSTDRILALAWTTAYHLSSAEATDAWQQCGHDPDLLANAARDSGNWPRAAPAPPARRQRVLDDTLRRASRTSPPITSVSKGAF